MYTYAKLHLGPVQLSASAHGTAVKKKAAEKSKKVWAGFLPCSSTQLKATGKLPKSMADKICIMAMYKSLGANAFYNRRTPSWHLRLL